MFFYYFYYSQLTIKWEAKYTKKGYFFSFNFVVQPGKYYKHYFENKRDDLFSLKVLNIIHQLLCNILPKTSDVTKTKQGNGVNSHIKRPTF